MTVGAVWEGRAWCFGDDVDTDVMLPGSALRLPPEEGVAHMFGAVRPGFAALVQPGDVLVGGRSFGTGSARPVAALVGRIGVRAMFAESMASLFQRNAVNAGLLAVAVPGVTALVADGDPVRVEPGRLTNLRTGAELALPRLPPLLTSIIDAGGLIPQLRRDGYLPPPAR